VDREWKCAAFAMEFDPQKTHDAITYYMEKVVYFLKKGDVTESARFAGTLAHLVQDSCIPVHTVNNIIINRLFPDRNGKYFFFHRLVDEWPFQPQKVKTQPELLGRNIDEAAYLLNETLFAGIEKIMGTLIPLLNAIQEGKNHTVDEIMQRLNEKATVLTTDLWHTLFCIAFQKIPGDAEQKFSCRELTKNPMILDYSWKFNRDQYIKAGIPFYDAKYLEGDPCRSRLSTDPYPYEPSVNYAYDGKGNVIPLALIHNGKRLQREQGLAGGGYAVASYRVPGKLYEELEVIVGVHPDSASDKEIVFGIWCHEAKKKLLAKGVSARGMEALHFKIKIPINCETLSLISADGNQHTSIVWLEPVLKARKWELTENK
jgi:hypothetical protein